ncbi:sensor histidine kinase [Streptomyces purpureus]|uniref:histidine kinase n=1 Tax=Streptomyces purpureus TaxID=1951 RepID=A0A918LNH0_9ACTN|nr:histidine kinase [Streptomyces purpureus]GGT27044.1 ATPase [Streptomyces purpureus]
MKDVVARGARYAAGLALGAATALVELLFLLAAGVLLLLLAASPRGRHAAWGPLGATAGALARLEGRRLDRFLGVRGAQAYGDGRALRYLAARVPLGLLGGVVLLCVLAGVAYGAFPLYGWLLIHIDNVADVVLGSLAGLLLLLLSLQGIFGLAAGEDRLARHLLGPSHHDELERRIAQLAASRAEVMDVVHDERRRIERDLHDGVQQRLVALGMLIGRARRSRDPERTAELLLQAHEESRQALTELREVAWRVHPTVLDEAGLRAALEAVAERSPLPVSLTYGEDGQLPRDLSRTVQTVAYFVVSEAVTNVVKHADATRITVQLRGEGDMVSVRVTDDGTGGADPAGGGLAGLAGRVAALDGRFAVDSPAGGPTTVRAELPCA